MPYVSKSIFFCLISLVRCVWSQGIPASAEIAVPVASDQTSRQDANPASESNVTQTASLAGLPNSSPLNLFPQVCEFFFSLLILLLTVCIWYVKVGSYSVLGWSKF